MSAVSRRNIRITRGQAAYLKELLQDDLEQSELTHSEERQARGLLLKASEALESFEAPSTSRSDRR